MTTIEVDPEIIARVRMHDFPLATSGQTTCHRCGFVLTELTAYLTPICLSVVR